MNQKISTNFLQNKSLPSKGCFFCCLFLFCRLSRDGVSASKMELQWMATPGRVMNLPGLVCIFQVGKNHREKRWLPGAASGGFLVRSADRIVSTLYRFHWVTRRRRSTTRRMGLRVRRALVDGDASRFPAWHASNTLGGLVLLVGCYTIMSNIQHTFSSSDLKKHHLTDHQIPLLPQDTTAHDYSVAKRLQTEVYSI